MGEYLAAPALLDEPAVQQSFLSYFNTIVVSPGDGACLSWSVMRALLLMPPCVREHLSCPAQRFLSERLDCIRKEDAALRAFHDFCRLGAVCRPSRWLAIFCYRPWAGKRMHGGWQCWWCSVPMGS